ncbi:MAG: hypothetical protein GXP55_19920 [Deltaproteobacteria bacterium]|nr:hypothetical protein [Deltaproteobacteria bacterium]
MASNEAEAGREPEAAEETPNEPESAKSSKAMSAGQRLAAAKATKAARKAAKRGRDAELVEDKALERAAGAASWMKQNRSTLTYGIGGALVLVAVLLGYSSITKGKAASAATGLWAAVEASQAPIREADQPAPDTDADAGPSFASKSAREEAVLSDLRGVTSEHAGTLAAHWASLAEAATLLRSGDASGAREAYEAVLSDAGDDSSVAARALEGIGYTYEAESEWDQALERYEELGNTEGFGNRERADYDIARMYLEKGDEVRAKEKLRALSEHLREEDAPELPYVRDQAELLLAQLDPSAARRAAPGAGGFGGFGAPGAGGGAGGAGSLTPEQIQQLIKRLQSKQGAGGLPGLPATGGQ